MLKASSKRRRTQAQIKEEKAAAAQRELDNETKDEEIHALQQQIMQLQEEAKSGAVANSLMSQFIENGLVEHKGDDNFIVHSSQGDHAFSSKKKH